MGKQYKILTVSEGALGTIFLGSSALPTAKMEAILNEQASQGWDVHFILVEKKRMLLFWQRESAVVIFSRNR